MKLFSTIESFPKKILHSGFWALALQVVDHLFAFGRTVVLAVLLLPKDFGLFGITLLTLVALDTLSRTGFHQALIQKEGDISPYLDTAWTVQTIRGLVLALILWVIAPIVASFFGEPAAVPLLRVISLSMVLQGLTNIGIVTFQKDLEFHKEFAFRFSGTLADLIVAITSAYVIRSAWALVFGFLARNLVQMVVSYIIHPYRPRFRFEIEKFTKLFRYGVWLLFGGLTVFIGSHGAGVVVGKIIGVTALGLYQMANRIPQMVVNNIGTAIRNVAFPTYAQLQSDPERLRDAYCKIAGVSVALLMPIAIGIAAVGSDFTRIFLGGKWMPMVPALVILAMANLVTSIASTGRPLFMGEGKPRFVFLMQSAKAATLLVLIYPLSFRWGILGASVAMAMSGASMFMVWCVIIRQQICFTLRDIYTVIVPPLIASIVMVGVIYGFRFMTIPLFKDMWFFNTLWFGAMISVGGATYILGMYLYQRAFPEYRLLEIIAKEIKT